MNSSGLFPFSFLCHSNLLFKVMCSVKNKKLLPAWLVAFIKFVLTKSISDTQKTSVDEDTEKPELLETFGGNIK